MSSIKLFVEGGGETKASGRAELRVAFDALISSQKKAAREKRMKWDTVFCGSRTETTAAFERALLLKEAEFVVLVIDSEDEVQAGKPSHPTPHERVDHLAAYDNWTAERKKLVTPEQIHLMTRCMEAWVIADEEKLVEFYGKGFKRNALPKRNVLDEEPKKELHAKIENATRDSNQGIYSKVEHASALLKMARPDKVAERCVSFLQFTQWLDAAIKDTVPRKGASRT